MRATTTSRLGSSGLFLGLGLFIGVLLRSTMAEPTALHAEFSVAHGAESATHQEEGWTLALANPVCPVMGGDADGETRMVWEGIEVSFCCPGCEHGFLEDPQEHLTALGIEDVDGLLADVSEASTEAARTALAARVHKSLRATQVDD